MKLDVGCGWRARGDVNVDLFLGRRIVDRVEEQNIYQAWYRSSRPNNFVCADCNYLPFRDNLFDVVFCFNLLEHKGVDLLKVCRELVRVARGVVEISVPSFWCARARLHDKMFYPHVFRTLFKRYRHRVKYGQRDWRLCSGYGLLSILLWHLPRWLPCPIPGELRCWVWKGDDSAHSGEL